MRFTLFFSIQLDCYVSCDELVYLLYKAMDINNIWLLVLLKKALVRLPTKCSGVESKPIFILIRNSSCETAIDFVY